MTATTTPDMMHIQYIKTITDGDHLAILEKESSYRGSWKKRGGVGAYMMLARKWDRIESFMENKFGYDVFEGVKADPTGSDGSVLAELRDLRRYLVLVESEMISRGVVALSLNADKTTWTAVQFETRDLPYPIGTKFTPPGTPEDGGHHENISPWVTEKPQFGDFQEQSTTTGKYRLRDHVSLPISSDHWREVSRLYVKTENGVVLKIEDCPESARSSYPSYPAELNHVELQQLPLTIWFKSYLYRWNPQEDKYILAHPAFCDESR